MNKVILDLGIPQSKKELHEYLAEELSFADYYGHNLDALYDMLTSISEPTAIGLFMPAPDFEELDLDLMMYMDRVKEVFQEAEKDNPEIAVILGDIVDNIDLSEDPDDFDELLGPDDFDELPDPDDFYAFSGPDDFDDDSETYGL